MYLLVPIGCRLWKIAEFVSSFANAPVEASDDTDEGKKIHPRARDVHRDEVAIADARRTDSGALVYSTSTGNVRPGMVNMGQLKK